MDKNWIIPGIIGAVVGFGLTYYYKYHLQHSITGGGSINREAILHITAPPYIYSVNAKTLHVRLRTAKKNVSSVKVIHSDTFNNNEAVIEMNISGSDELFDYWFCEVDPPFLRCAYTFHIYGSKGEEIYYNEDRFSPIKPAAGQFKYPYLCAADVYAPPEWVKDTIWYQIFPERFANGDPLLNPPIIDVWGSKPTVSNFFGGDFRGVIDHIPHLKELGITGIYFTPIFRAPTNHKYDTVDYFEIDPQFGDKAVFKEMVQQLHENGIRVMLDCVFNHCGEQFPMFQDVKLHGERSKYKDWFHIRKFPITTDPLSYATFSFEKSMPKLNTSNPDTQNYLISVATYWIKEFDIDGWRLDVSNEIDFKFWRQFCSAVKAVKSDAFILGELWHNSLNWITADKFDSVMNYPLFYAISNCFANQGPLINFQQSIDHFRHWYPETANLVLFNLLSSHDVPRLLSRCNNDINIACLSYAFLFTYPGTPCIYYGDEIGLNGDMDPDNRKCMEWDKAKWNFYFYNSLQKLIRIRKTQKVLKTGSFQWIDISDSKKYLVFKRQNESDSILVVIYLEADSQSSIQLDLTKLDPQIRNHTLGYDLYNDLELDLRKVYIKKKSFAIIKLNK